MAIRDTQDCILFEVPTLGTGLIRDTQDSLLLEVPFFSVPSVTVLTPPSGFHPQDVTMRMMNVIGETSSPFSGEQQEQFWAQWWEMDVSLIPQMRADYEAVVGFLAALSGNYGQFLLGIAMRKLRRESQPERRLSRREMSPAQVKSSPKAGRTP